MDSTKYKLVDWVPTSIVESGQYPSDCNTCIFYNAGTQTVTIDNIWPLLPMQGIELPCYPGEMCRHTFDIRFDTVAGKVNNLAFYHKVYVDASH